jgi:lipoprotein-anchoring transpeptidase ErfK/SrfK
MVSAYLVELERSLGDKRFFDHDEGLAAVREGLHTGEMDALRVRYHPTTYVVQPTDSMVTISFKMGMPYWKIHEANPSVAARGLVVGETIIAPPADAMLTLPVVENKRIVISITQQRMWVYQDGELIREHIVSTGMSGSPTLSGIFQVQWHYVNAYGSRWDLWMPHFLGIYEAAPGFINGIHGLPLLSNGVRLWGDVLGRPASYGCIILTLAAAEELYYWAEDGVVVEIQS